MTNKSKNECCEKCREPHVVRQITGSDDIVFSCNNRSCSCHQSKNEEWEKEFDETFYYHGEYVEEPREKIKDFIRKHLALARSEGANAAVDYLMATSEEAVKRKLWYVTVKDFNAARSL